MCFYGSDIWAIIENLYSSSELKRPLREICNPTNAKAPIPQMQSLRE